MKSSWTKAAQAVFHKVLLTETRSRHGIMTSGLFGLMAIACIAFTTGFEVPGPSLVAGLLGIVLLFAGIIAIPRTFIAEEEQKTFDLLRLLTPCSAAFFGKYLFACLLGFCLSLFLGALFAGIIPISVERPLVYGFGLALFGWAMASTLSLTGLLVLQSKNRWILSGVVSLPLLFPLLFMGVGLFRVAYGMGSLNTGYVNMLGLAAYGVGAALLGPYLADFVWRQSRDPGSGASTDQNGDT